MREISTQFNSSLFFTFLVSAYLSKFAEKIFKVTLDASMGQVSDKNLKEIIKNNNIEKFFVKLQ